MALVPESLHYMNVEKRERISDADFSQLQKVGFSEAEIAEIVTHVIGIKGVQVMGSRC